jgi:hypothetical protein
VPSRPEELSCSIHGEKYTDRNSHGLWRVLERNENQ